MVAMKTTAVTVYPGDRRLFMDKLVVLCAMIKGTSIQYTIDAFVGCVIFGGQMQGLANHR